MKPPPSGWPRISNAIHYEDAAAAIDWLCDAFGFEVLVNGGLCNDCAIRSRKGDGE